MTPFADSNSGSGSLHFHKMHGAGNDFVLLDFREQERELPDALVRHLADRKKGVGCDQVLILRPASHDHCMLHYDIFNTDGSPAGQCGNGARCIALFLQLNGEVSEQSFRLESPSGEVEIWLCPDGQFEVDMGKPDFNPESVPISLRPEKGQYHLQAPKGALSFSAVSMGNPHAVLEVDDIRQAPLDTSGRFLSENGIFPEGCNAGFVQITDRNNIHLRVFERGAGETLACGSGACAAVAVLRRSNRVDDVVNVFQPGGHLVIKWSGAGQSVKMKGPAAYVFGGMLHEK